jgi:NAD(P)-dependent dehydrogenase (short-subunit alcohol dehydrogenase family)
MSGGCGSSTPVHAAAFGDRRSDCSDFGLSRYGISAPVAQFGQATETQEMTYTTAHTPITTPFGFESTAAEVIAGTDLSGKRAIVTGGSSGIGVETARALASAGADVTLAVRDPDAGRRTAADITGSTGSAAVHVGRLDLADPASVAAFVTAWEGPLDILVNNAGVMALPALRLTPGGWELQFATNHLGHFSLALGLHAPLAASGDSRIVSLSSIGHLRSPIVFDDINFSVRPYDPRLAYGQSKTANVLFAVAATQRWASEGIYANAVHPGAIIDTNLTRYSMDAALQAQLRASGEYTSPEGVRMPFKTIAQGAATSVLVATSPQLEHVGGRYFEDCNEGAVLQGENLARNSAGVAAYGVNPDNARRLWELSLHAFG